MTFHNFYQSTFLLFLSCTTLTSSSFNLLRTHVQPQPKNDIPADLYDTNNSRFSDASLFRCSPDGIQRSTFPWRTTAIAITLFLIGLTFLLLALLHFQSRDRETTIAFIVIGSISFLPGVYASFNIVQWLRGVPGFHPSQCTSFSLFFFLFVCTRSVPFFCLLILFSVSV